MPLKELIDLLDALEVSYQTITHPVRFTAEGTADAAHVDPDEFAKTVVVKIDDEPAMAVIRAQDMLDLDQLRETTGAGEVELVSEWDFDKLFPGVEMGAMPPVGQLFEMPVYVDSVVSEDEMIYFNAGTHSELIEMGYADYESIVSPTVASIASRD